MPSGVVNHAPESNEIMEVVPLGDSPGQPVRFFVYEDVVQEIRYSGGFWSPELAVGFLIGVFGADESGGFVEVRGFDGLERVESDAEYYKAVRSQTDRWIASGEGIGNPIVGVFFTVPGGEARLTEEMARVHLSLFNIPFQVALVYDPESDQIAGYARAPRRKFVNCALTLVRARSVEDDGGSESAERLAVDTTAPAESGSEPVDDAPESSVETEERHETDA